MKIKVKECVMWAVWLNVWRRVKKKKKRNCMLWNESGRNGSGLLKKKSIKKSQK